MSATNKGSQWIADAIAEISRRMGIGSNTPSQIEAACLIIKKHGPPEEKVVGALLEACRTIEGILDWLSYQETPPKGWDELDAYKRIFAHAHAGVIAVMLQKKAALAEYEKEEP